jgi:UDP-N-acetylglucosamine/UDP-N-acetylgalactosamine diphosphorylase
MPAVDRHGKLLLAEKHRIFVSPDGHGGMLAALDRCGCLADMKARGIKHIFYGQVDNPLIQACDPGLIGYHILRDSELTSQVVRKNDPLQRVGNVVSIDGDVQIIEYSDLPEEQARLTNENGQLKLWAGSIAVHVFDREFLERANNNTDALPIHRANKKVPYLDTEGNLIKPDSPNATKFEKFIFDLLPAAKNSIICEVDAADGFCAVKNAAPAPSETPEHVRAAICELHKRWMKACGVAVADGVTIEISPLHAVDSKQLSQKTSELTEIKQDTYFE